MSYPQQPWPSSPPPWPSPSEHSPKEIEHRLTVLEETSGHHGDHHEEHYQHHDRHDQRLNMHEKAILGVFMGLYVLMQERFPGIAAFLRGLLP